MMTVAAARALSERRRLLRRHRRAVGRLQPRPPHPRAGHHADLRIRHDRHRARRAAALDRRRRALRHGAHHRRRCRRCSATGCRAGASPSASSAARRSTASPTSTPPSSAPTTSRRCGCPAAAARRRSPPIAARSSSPWRWAPRAFVEKLALHHLARPRRGPATAARALGVHDQGPDAGHHRPLRAGAGPGDAAS